jgi:L-asparaginase II
MLAGTDRFDTWIATAFGEAVLCKCGAEGTAAAAIPELGIGLAIKIDDGAGRAVEVAMASLLLRFLADSHVDREELRQRINSPLRNWNGLTVGRLRAC